METNKKLEVKELTLAFSEPWFKYDILGLNFNKIMVINRPTRVISEDGEEQWVLKAKPICEDNTAEFIYNNVQQLNGW